MSVLLVERDMSNAELALMRLGFDEHSADNYVDLQSSDRFGFVALDGERFVGCSSGLAYKNGETYSGWFHITDLYVVKEFRSKGIGSKLLQSLESSIGSSGVNKIWVWTAEHEANTFYLKHKYRTFAELENWYSNGGSRVALRKFL